jgi:prepilin peptidase CpaA
MDLSAAIQLTAAIAALICLGAAALQDGLRYRISNPIVLALVVCFAVFAAAKGSLPFIAWSLGAGTTAMIIAAILFALGVFGGGDAKLIGAMGLWTQFAALPRFLVVMTACGGLLGLVWLARRHLARKPSVAAVAPDADAGAVSSAPVSPVPVPQAPARFSRLPYGIAIAAAGVDYFLFTPLSPIAEYLPF